MKIRREFLDWKQPALPAAAEAVLRRFEKNGTLDLANVVVVVPGGRAGRRLLELIVIKSAAASLLLTPPAIVTPDRFPELLYQAKWPFADTLTQQLAWMTALQESPPSLKDFLPFPPDRGDVPRWLAIAESLRKLHTELAADGLDCAKVVDGATNVEGFAEGARWMTLAAVQRRYLDRLDALELWDVQTARLVAIEKREITTDKEIVLVGTVDLNRTQRRMLDQVASQVTALVVAPNDLANQFDDHGCLIPSKWAESELPLTDDQIDRVDGPADQAEATTRWLESLGGRFRADEITIGLPDEKIVSQIERQLAQWGLAGRWAVGKQVSASAPYRLLQIAADYAARQRYRDLAALVRHPDGWAFASNRLSVVSGQKPETDILTALDEYAAERFPAHLDRERLEKDAAGVLAIYDIVAELIRPLAGNERPLAEWTEPLRTILQTVYGTKPLDRQLTSDRYLLESLEFISRALDAVGQLPQALQPTVDVRQACRIVLAEVAAETIPPPAGDDQIELLGWLDLPLDDAPATLVTTFNDGFVPSTTSTDAFLPNTLRESLGLMHNDRRLARDAYALSLLIASRKELKVVVAKRDSQSNPLLPSRLLFLTDAEKAVARGRRFFGDLPPQPPRRNLLAPAGGAAANSKIVRPLPQKLEKPITALSVTRFRDYLACPYRFYLRHVLKLEAIGDDATELDGAAFGDLVHRVLASFGRSEEAKDVRTSSDWTKIAGYLDDKLDQVAAARFGKKQARPAVLVQVEQLRLRLRAFAQWQAQRSSEGWRILFSEDADDQRKLSHHWPVDGNPFTLEGRIDRIDYHEALGRLAVLDYKTADSGSDPLKTHRKADKWIDLQLPLYRHLVGAATPKGIAVEEMSIDLGYIVLPLDINSVGLLRAEFDDAMLISADETARGIVRLIWDEQFWPPTSPPPDFCDDLAVICQDHALSGGECANGEAA
ncbi:MAG TPA: PD-(D/E)XK nuclease family protein [Pirellulaceae bacterium]|jgi:RecB family exonuclease